MKTCSTCKLSSEIVANDSDEFSFRKVSETDIPLLLRYFNAYPSRSCDFTVGGVLIWTEYFDYKIAEISDSLIIMGRNPDDGTLLFYAPRGPISIERYVGMVRRYCEGHNERFHLLIPEENSLEASDANISADNSYAAEWREYLYDAEKMATFSGRKMEKKRNHLNFFLNNYAPFSIEMLGPDNVSELITFTIAFQLSHADMPIADYEARQVMEVLRNYDSYPFVGIAVRHEGKIIGYAFGEKADDTFVVHAEKGDTAYRGIYQLLASSMTKAAMAKYPDLKYVNREDDMGNENLKQSKLSYHPALIIDKKVFS